MSMEQAILDAILPFVPHDQRGGGKAAGIAVKKWCADNAMALDLKRARAIAVDVWNKAVLDDLIDGSHSQIRERQPGYYWVRQRMRSGSTGPWEIGEWYGHDWRLMDYHIAIADSGLANIGPMVTMPDGLPTEPDMRD